MNATGQELGNGTGQEYASVRACASAVSFLLLAFINLIINYTILRDEELRGQARFVLVFHLLFSGLVYFGVNSAFYLQIYLGARLSAGACLTLVTVLVTSASNILLTLTAMALDRYCAICFPLKYSALCGRQRPWLLGLGTWALALIIPLSLFLPPGAVAADPSTCRRDQLKKGEVQKIVLLSLCTGLILFSYARILLEGRRLGVLSRRNRIGRKTIVMHGAQLAVYLLPTFVNFALHLLNRAGHLQAGAKELFGVVNFAFFSLAQCIAPVIYGLRKEELLEKMHHRFPCLYCNLKGVLEWTVRAARPGLRHPPRERAMTAAQRLISVESPQTPV
ncbi:odorant receptor 131-2 [Lepisosteus oculatus]|uniref:Zgc:194312 n=1 Tax=Lepisosteus oculatus TaxID=7918 RepID=W5NAS9_LEPOC|nr:PREDICTED: olfactory receptor 11A1-like [Lepisosteus oculatus]XP_015196318.1 PREDICTED: olfactory receptor 11A1-like [Lepisosteus oculatus]